MVDIRQILCPIDFSEFSRHALDHAMAIAKWYDARVTALHVCRLVPVAMFAPTTAVPAVTPPTPEELNALLASVKRFVNAEAGSVPIDCQIGEGDAATEILERARATPSDLIVLGTHGRSGFERLVLGSVTEKVLRRAACPVLTVPSGAIDAVAMPPPFKRIVCATDFSDCATHALTYAMSLAQEADAELIVMHVIEVAPERLSEGDEAWLAWPTTLSEYIATIERERREKLASVVPERVRAYCHVETILTSGKPYREVLRVAAEHHAELIVVGVHGRGVADLLFFGSTAQHIVRQAVCPVLTIRKG